MATRISRAKRAALVAALGVGMSGAQPGQPPPAVDPPPCGNFLVVGAIPPFDNDTARLFWSEVPDDVVIFPVYYTAYDAASPHPEEVAASVGVEVLDLETEGYPAVPGSITLVEPKPGVTGQYLIHWSPDEPFRKGARYQANVGPGNLEDPVECAVGIGQFYFLFDVSTKSRTEWAEHASLALTAIISRGNQEGCCRVASGECEGNQDCFQCWDWFDTSPYVHAVWHGPGIPYLYLSVESASPNLEPMGGELDWQLGANLPPIDGGLLGNIYALADYGPYCVSGAVGSRAGSGVSLEACDIDTGDTIGGAGEVSCRQRVAVATCDDVPDGISETGLLYVVRGPTQQDAQRALAAAPEWSLADGACHEREPSPAAVPPDGGNPRLSDEADGGVTTVAPQGDLPAPSESGCSQMSRPTPRVGPSWLAAVACAILASRRRRRT